ncbi:hypothetical protein HO173_007454 [Letharia columbiana]|uniref:Flavin-nucleotide-binding protein n=1 Tax=Letharia columbiana TaxID=112416 RepID=A0A8H6FTD3_9LECA|nr:uncharacterized protein HO173_007454 [Letharia columbiana]KAF6234421.1 hypothetical protein HO173_007454 [Letharia columbiana]
MGRTLVYPRVQKNTVHRKDDRATYDLHTIHSIINETPVLLISFNSSDPEDPFPTILPMIGTMGSFAYPSADLNDPLECYLHGYVSSGCMKQARAHPESGLAITIAATKVDGIVLSLTPNSHSYNYRSAVLFGYGSLVEDAEEKLWAMQLVTNSVLPGRWDHTRTPPDKAEMASTTILKVKIVNGSGKIRTGGPGDEKKDTEREDLLQRVWTGVVPMWETAGEPVAGGDGRVEDVPEHVRAFRDDTNKVNEKYAKTAAVEKT